MLLRILLGGRWQGRSAGLVPDGKEETTRQPQSVQGMAQSQPTPTTAGSTQNPDPESTGKLQLLPGGGQQQRLVGLLQGGCKAVVQVVESTESKMEPDLVKAEEAVGAL